MKKGIMFGMLAALCVTVLTLISKGTTIKAAELNSDQYNLIAQGVNATNSNDMNGQNPTIFNYNSDAFHSLVDAKKNINTLSDYFSASSSMEFSNKYTNNFSSSIETAIGISSFSTDVSGKFIKDVNTENYKQKIETYDYYYWLLQKYVVNMDWDSENVINAFSESFIRDLNKVNSISLAKQLLEKYGTHVFSKYILGGKLEITKYFVQDASYNLSETEKSVAASLNSIVDVAKVDAKVNGTVDLSRYESTSSSNSHYYSKITFDATGGEPCTAVNASDLFTYKQQIGTDTASGYLYEDWTGSFKNDNVPLAIIKTENSKAIWDLLDSSVYENQIQLLKKAYDFMTYQNYAKICDNFGISCDYIDSITYKIGDSNQSIKSIESIVNLPANVIATINLSDIITGKLKKEEYSLKVSANKAATLDDNQLTIKAGTEGRTFDIELYVNDIKVYTIKVNVKSNNNAYFGGYGTEHQPYLINNREQLIYMLENYDDESLNYKLVNDIDMGGYKLHVRQNAFNGTFDGNGYTIKNFTVTTSSINDNFNFLGLFGKNNGTIKNVRIENGIILFNGLLGINNDDLEYSSGILVGENKGIISNCIVKNSAIRIAAAINKETSKINIGGIAGKSTGLIELSATTNSNLSGVITKGQGKCNAGGIVGLLEGAKVDKCYLNTTIVTINKVDQAKYSMGGIAGEVKTSTNDDLSIDKSIISNCIVYNNYFGKNGSSFGNIVGIAKTDSCDFITCYYQSMLEESVDGKAMAGCKKLISISLNSIANSKMYEDWIDTENGPILSIHRGEE